MKKKRASSPAFVVVVFFLFVLLHQTDKLLIGSLRVPRRRVQALVPGQ